MSNLPILQKRDRNLSISIFSENITDRSTGEIRTRFSFAIQRSYKDKNGEWKNQTINTYSDEMLPFANLITQSYNMLNDYIGKQRSSKQKAASAAQSARSYPEDDDIPF